MTCPVCKGRGEVALMLRCGAEYQKRVTVCPECESSGSLFVPQRGVVVLDYERPTLFRKRITVRMSSLQRWEPMPFSGRESRLNDNG